MYFRHSEGARTTEVRSEDEKSEPLQGTLEMLVLKLLHPEPMRGWGMGQRIQQMSKDVILVSQGTLYPALQRMKRRGWVKSSWQTASNNRRARYYELTAARRKHFRSRARHLGTRIYRGQLEYARAARDG